MRWPALLSEAEQIQTDITTPPGTRELKPEKEGLCESLILKAGSAFTLLPGLFKARQVTSGPRRACLALWAVGMATLWPNFSERPRVSIFCLALSPCVTNSDVKIWLWKLGFKGEADSTLLAALPRDKVCHFSLPVLGKGMYLEASL